MLRTLVLLIPLLFTVEVATGAEVMVGRASIIDGDTVEIHGTRIRLFGIDAPESRQPCIVRGKTTLCGQYAGAALADKVGAGTVTCESKDRDQYGRVVAVCRFGGEDLSAWMVGRGWALAYRQYSTDYVPQEEKASAAKLGLWQGEFVAPWDWRSGKRLKVEETSRWPFRPSDTLQAETDQAQRPTTETQRTASCDIKGNINDRGERIYHVPGGKFHKQTGIDTSRGERWFCTEAEARENGWRPSKR